MGEIREDFKIVKGLKETGVRPSTGAEYTERDYVKDLTYVYGKSAKALIKLYGPSVALGAVSIGALSGSHVQMTRRNSALTATAAALSKAYDDYRERVRQELGEEKELQLHRAITEQEVDVDGKKQVVQVADPNQWSVYARIFDEASTEWQKDAELNRIFIQHQQNYANHLLQSRGHLFLNEVYDALGLERSRAGAVVGWILNGENSDNYVDFGIFEAYSSRFVNNLERSVILDFNVDGIIYDKI
jgi:hypothetical protein